MNDYIKRDDAITEICRKGCDLERGGIRIVAMVEAKQFAVDVLDNIPAADVRENVRGKWIDAGDFWSCTVCGSTRLKRYNCAYGKCKAIVPDNYCPACGADMRGKTDG